MDIVPRYVFFQDLKLSWDSTRIGDAHPNLQLHDREICFIMQNFTQTKEIIWKEIQNDK